MDLRRGESTKPRRVEIAPKLQPTDLLLRSRPERLADAAVCWDQFSAIRTNEISQTPRLPLWDMTFGWIFVM